MPKRFSSMRAEISAPNWPTPSGAPSTAAPGRVIKRRCTNMFSEIRCPKKIAIPPADKNASKATISGTKLPALISHLEVNHFVHCQVPNKKQHKSKYHRRNCDWMIYHSEIIVWFK